MPHRCPLCAERGNNRQVAARSEPGPGAEPAEAAIRRLGDAYRRRDAVDPADPAAVEASDGVLEARVKVWRALVAEGWNAPEHALAELARDTALSKEVVPPHAEDLVDLESDSTGR